MRVGDILKRQNRALNGSKILIVGVTYKKDVKDLRKAPPLKLIEILQDKKCFVDYHDPIIPYLKVGNIHLQSVPLTKANLPQYDVVLIATDHTKVDYKLILKHARSIYDIRNVYAGVRNRKINLF